MFSLARGDMADRWVAWAPSHSRQRWIADRAPFRVRERGHRYDDEGSEARSLGSVSVGAGTWWSVALSAPGAPKTALDLVLVHIERHGAPADERHAHASVDLVLPSSEIDAVVTLLGGVVAQARRDGVLSAAGS